MTRPVLVTRRRFHATFTAPTTAIDRLIRWTVPKGARELADGGERTWLVFASRVDRLIEVLTAHGIEVVETGTGESGVPRG